MTYSQRREEQHILEHFGDFVGSYLDIGSYDGRTFSNVRELAERGWKGVCVEPAAHAFSKMLDDPPPGAKLVHAALGPRTGLCSFIETKDAVSTTDRAHVRKWKEHVTFVPAYTVSVTIRDLLREFPGPFQFVSIDCEGTSMWLFREMQEHFDRLDTSLICVEHDGAQVHLDGWKSIYRSAENEILAR